MKPVKLYTADGGFVTSGAVLPFLPGMEATVLIWGERVFTLDYASPGVPDEDASGALHYTEAFAVALVAVDEDPRP